MEVTPSTYIAVELKDITVNISDLDRLKAPSTNGHQSIITQIAVKFILRRKAPVNIELVADVVVVIVLTLAGVIIARNLTCEIVANSVKIKIVVIAYLALTYVFRGD